MIRLLFLMFILTSTAAEARLLVVDLSENLIKLNTDFAGKDIFLFGARNDPGELVIVVRGPKQSYIVRKKEKIFGMWVKSKQVVFNNIDQFYMAASNLPPHLLTDQALLEDLEIGAYNINFENYNNYNADEIVTFREALLESQQRQELYHVKMDNIYFIDDMLFKYKIHFSKNIAPGIYTADIYLFKDKRLIDVQSTPIIIEKTGIDAVFEDFAYNAPYTYGFFSIGGALVLGWLSSLVFRRKVA